MTSTPRLTPKFEAITPRLPVSDVDKALAFYVDQLGFTLGWKWAIRLLTQMYVVTP